MKIIVLIVNYNSWDKTLAMIESSELLEVKPKIYILDNNSNVDKIKSINDIKVNHSNVTIVNFTYNYGYFGAIHEFLRLNIDLQFDWIFIANPDLIFSDPYLFNNLGDIFPEKQDIGIYCPSIFSITTGENQNPFLKRGLLAFTIISMRLFILHFL